MNYAARIDFPTLMEPVCTRLLGEPNAQFSKYPKDVRYGTRGSLSVNFDTGQFYDHEANIGGGVIDLIKHKRGVNHSGSVAWLRHEGLLGECASPTPPAASRPKLAAVSPKIAAKYDYRDEAGRLLFQVVRYDPKDFRQRRPGTEHGTWVWNLEGVRRVPYQLPDLIKAVAEGRTIHISEGEKDTDNLRALGFAATTNPGGVKKWQQEFSKFLCGADVVVLPHNDADGREHGEQVAASLHGIASRVRLLDIGAVWPECPPKGDVSDWLLSHTASNLRVFADALPDWKLLDLYETATKTGIDASAEKAITSSAPRPYIASDRLKPLDLKQFLQLAIKPREMLLDPILPEKGLAMLYAARGTGKTHVAIGICFAIATGTKFLKWQAPKPRRVLLIDGEMPAAALQERLASIVASASDVQLDPDNIRILAGDLIEAGGIGNLASPDVQAEIDRWLDGIDVLALDNLSSLTAVIRDNDAESWGPIQEWLLKLRRRRISVLIVHHAGKGGQQRGTSRREDVLDTSISLRRPADYSPTEGARFEVHLEKARGVYGDAAKPFEAKLEVRDGAAVWTTREVEDANRARVQALLDDGLSVRDIADETGVPKSTVHRIKKALQAAEGGTDAEQ
jgi:AAA domain/Homeodomain-like domain